MSNYRTDRLERLARAFKALSNPNRLRIFLCLASCCGAACDEGETCRCVGELGEELECCPSTVSHHLKELREAGLIRMERNGRTIACSVDPEALRELTELLAPCC